MPDPRLVDRARQVLVERRRQKLTVALERILMTSEAQAWRAWCATPMGQRFVAYLEEEFFQGAFDGENADQAVGARGVVEFLRRLRAPVPEVKSSVNP